MCDSLYAICVTHRSTPLRGEALMPSASSFQCMRQRQHSTQCCAHEFACRCLRRAAAAAALMCTHVVCFTQRMRISFGFLFRFCCWTGTQTKSLHMELSQTVGGTGREAGRRYGGWFNTFAYSIYILEEHVL